MSSYDPRLLYSIAGIKAYHIQDGKEQELTPSGPQTLSLLMVPTNSPFADLSTTKGQNEAPEEDFYLHLNLPPELDMPLPATTQIYHQPPRSYLIPRWEFGPDSGVFLRIEFPSIGHGPGKVSQEDVDTFETILAQCTAFLERSEPPTEKGRATKPYNPADYQPGEGYGEKSGKLAPGHVVLVDEDNGSVVGELADGSNVVEDPKLKTGIKGERRVLFAILTLLTYQTDPVEIEIGQDGKVQVRPISEDYLAMARHPAYKNSALVQNAAAASRLIVTGSSYLSNMMASQADSFTKSTQPLPRPMTFKPATHERVRKINTFTNSAAGLSTKTVGQVTKYAQNAAAHLAGHRKTSKRGFDEQGRPVEEYKPGFLNKSMIAFSTLADGIAYSGKSLLTTSGAAATTVVGHRYGAEAGSVTSELAGGVKNVGLVYIDVTGVSRRAIIKSVAKGMVVGKVKGGGEVVVGGGDGGVVPPQYVQPGVTNDKLGGASTSNQAPGVVGFGARSSNYTSGVGESLEGQPAYPPDKKYG